jgi:hypothetical protein
MHIIEEKKMEKKSMPNTLTIHTWDSDQSKKVISNQDAGKESTGK